MAKYNTSPAFIEGIYFQERLKFLNAGRAGESHRQCGQRVSFRPAAPAIARYFIMSSSETADAFRDDDAAAARTLRAAPLAEVGFFRSL